MRKQNLNFVKHVIVAIHPPVTVTGLKVN